MSMGRWLAALEGIRAFVDTHETGKSIGFMCASSERAKYLLPKFVTMFPECDWTIPPVTRRIPAVWYDDHMVDGTSHEHMTPAYDVVEPGTMLRGVLLERTT